MDRVDAEAAISILRKEIDAGRKHRSFPRKHTLANIFSRAVNKMTTIEDVVYDDYSPICPRIWRLSASYSKAINAIKGNISSLISMIFSYICNSF